MAKRSLLALIFIVFCTQFIQPQTVIGKYAGEFLASGVGGRPLGMGGAFTAIADDITAAYYNPAGLAQMDYPQLSLMHDQRYGNLVSYNYAAVGIPYGKDFTFAVSALRLAVDGIYDTREALYDANGDGILDIRTNDKLDYSKIKEFSNQDWAFYLSAAKRIDDKLMVGANFKVIRRDIAEFGATGIGFDIGAMYRATDQLMLGASVQDVTTTLVAWSTGRNELITPTLKLGAAYSVSLLGGVLLPTVDFDLRFEGRKYASTFNVGPVSVDPHVGFEYNFKNIVSVRAGYNDVKQFTVGAGIKLPKLNIDYSFARFNMSEDDRLPDSHRISITLTLEEPRFKR
ncbi:MAG: hypothetical protein B6D45_12440 [Ignavibacteriales bacterium UTCHB3]|nr:MAG: hypothetical protein B6D45_12440 [Ignavibacteriales bacterium UTCHB3]